MAIVKIKTGQVVKPAKYEVHLLNSTDDGRVILDEHKYIFKASCLGQLQLQVSHLCGTDVNFRDIVPGFWEAINYFGFKRATVLLK